ncbi:anthranilate phosphoribosyltransferase [Neisseria weaveri]|uniref:anthranilate phosphoribosyltransferase n=1 Tax=Neisseria weaveri TaxID=28091 RepID=UPI0007C9A250|nr:anthranilate phosphoribosyltransferase [Neisseria weaveri]SAY51088.1 anthranilate phosphoribosyltransferase [Neisseria weaveri]
MITPQQALLRLIDNNELFYDEMTDLMRQIMRGEVAPELIAAILTGLRIKVESVSEIAAAAAVMREFAVKVPVADTRNLVDIVGTGGDNAHTFNISSTAMFVAAAAGAKIAKHGGRSVSSSSGSADIIEQMGASLTLSPEQVGTCIDQVGIGFMFAPNHHSSMRYVAPVRRALGFRSIFNILGPMTNPASAPNQVLGVFHIDLCGILSRVLQQLGSKHVLVVHGSDGLDEITVTGSSRIAELKDGRITEYDIHPENFGLPVYKDLSGIKAANTQESLTIMNQVLNGQHGPARDIVVLNAAATIYAGGKADSLADGIAAAQKALDSGKAKAKQAEFIRLSTQLAESQAQ